MNKVTTLDDAVAHVTDGAHVAFGGFAITRCVTAAARELVRGRRRDLTLSQVVGGMDTDLLVGGDCVRRLIYSGGSLDRFGPLGAVNRAILAGKIEVEECSSLTMTLRFHAGALGLPFIPARSLLGSELLEDLSRRTHSVQIGEDPFTGAPVALYAPLKPDVAFVHVDAADKEGNAAISGPTWGVRETAFAALYTVVLAETIVASNTLDPDRIAIPAPLTDAVVHVRFGAHPTAAYGLYDYDRDQLTAYANASKTGGETYERYLSDYVNGARSHEQYLELIGVVL